MKDLDVWVFVSVFQEMMGAFLWLFLAGAALATLAFAYVLVRDRGIVSARLVVAEVVGFVGGFVAIIVMQGITHSGFADLGGPVDWLLVAAIWVMGAVGATLLTYALLSLLGAHKVERPEHAPQGRPVAAQ